MAQVITIAGEQLFALKAQNNEQLDIDTFIFANVPGQDPNAPINRSEGVPPLGQQVHTQIVQQVGRVNDNVVIYSTVLDSLTGPFEFNWVGLYSSVNQTLIAISHIPTVQKTVTVPGAAGNTLNRNFGIEYSGIADLTGITVAPETWQLDYTARLNGMDELTRQLAADMNGNDWFIEDGFKVVPRATINTFKVTPGAGYVSGLRIQLDAEQILTLSSYPQFVYVDAWFDGTTGSQWKGQTAFTVTNTEMDDYVDVNGKQHYVFKLANITAADTVQDLRTAEGIAQKVEKVQADLVVQNNFNTAVSAGTGRAGGVTLIDMHYGAMRGRGLTDTETLSDGKGGYTLSALAAAGQPDIVLTDNASQVFDIPLVVGQLVAYLAANGEYYSASIKSISGTAPCTITLNADIESDIAAGTNLFSFMSNESHPIFYGYRAIADYAVRKAKQQHHKIADVVFAATNAASMTVNSTNSYLNCGSATVLAYDITMPAALTDGVSASFTAPETGAYIARIVINTNGHPVNIGWSYSGLGSTKEVNCSDIQSFDIPITVRSAAAGGLVSITVVSQDAAAVINMLGKIEILKIVGTTPNLAACKHVLLGDSWFAQSGVFERLQQRFPLANIVNKGIGGNTAVQLLNRFDSDVTPEKPDIVWVMVGTNDYYQSVSNDLFNYYVNQIISKCAEIGAHVMFFNSSVGGAPFDGARFDRSRQLNTNTNYIKSTATAKPVKRQIFNIAHTVIPNGAAHVQLINFGIHSNKFRISSYFISAGSVKVGDKSTLNGLLSNPFTLTAGSYVTTDVDLTFSGPRFIDARIDNSSGSDVTVYGYIEVETDA